MEKFIFKTNITLLLLLFSTIFSKGQGYQAGSIVYDFKLADVSGGTPSLSDYKEAKGFIIVFTSNACPFSKLYEERLKQLNNKYSGAGIQVIAINPNDPGKEAEDSFEKMKVKAREKGFNFPYLYDEGQKMTTLYKPSRTPHVFLLKKENNNYKVVYSGAIDDNSADPTAVKVRYIDNAADELIAGKKISVPSTKAVGCTIKWKNGE